ncbi:hydroxylysine kinase-like [Uloborus diversus]|uniref:hydroxylysine kinase-like n=1 Tax=Uloborus diversus TaxID=327109 RepID=UPI0024097CBB|nr:hydroxylysine kinase-like [Uloborus diversus]XP_054720043.1 hydroxylysine kinase-like [Uloborus diversus]
MDIMDTSKPNVSEEQVKDLALSIFDLTVTSIKKMVSFDDQNFHIKVSKNHKNPHIKDICIDGYTLKITNTVKSATSGHFDSMHRAMIHFNKKGLRVPLPVRNMDGKTWKMVQVPVLNKGKNGVSTDDPCGIHLLTFLPGVTVSTQPYTSSILFQWGALLAQFHNAAQDYSCPIMAEKDIFWNLEHVPEIINFMDGLEDERRALILNILNLYPENIAQKLPELPKGFIHGDFNENNILVQLKTTSDCDASVDGILDFDDMHFGTYAWDVGMMLAYTLLDCKTMDPLEGAGHALAGYLSRRQLCSLELSVLKMCISCRLAQSLVLSAYSHRLDPSNAYLLSSAKTGWDRLEQVWNTENESLLNKWKGIQNLYIQS